MEESGKIEYSKNKAVIRINPKIYPLDVVHSAAYIMIDKAFILLDGEPEKEITVSIECKEGADDVVKIVQEFNEELLNYAVYKIQNERNKDLREAILKRVLITNQVIDCIEEIKRETIKNQKEDPEEIFKTWEQKEDADKHKKNPPEQ
jgi:His-Xaa-Ser system protein HxsD